jgi:hypothetical protein
VILTKFSGSDTVKAENENNQLTKVWMNISPAVVENGDQSKIGTVRIWT